MAKSRNRGNGNRPDSVVAISPQQVNSYPVPGQAITVKGERITGVGDQPNPAQTRKENFLQTARDRFKVCIEAESNRRADFLEDLKFRVGIQWDQSIEITRRNQKRPCLTINRIDGFLRHVVNNFRQERPGIQVDPIGEGTDEDIAKVREGLIRHIEVQSAAEEHYDIAMENMCTMGLGWLRVVDDWSDPKSFDKDLFIRAIPNTFSVYSDPFVVQPDWSDMKFAFIVEDLTRKEFIEQYGDDNVATTSTDFSSVGDTGPYWFPGGKIRVAEYFYISEEKDILCELEDGTTALWSELEELEIEGELGIQPAYRLIDGLEGERKVMSTATMYLGRTRDAVVPIVNWAKITACDILRERKWKGRYIPLIPVIGNQIEIEGQRLLVGMVRYAREPQRMFNYMYSSFVETCALAPKAPFIAEVDQIPDGMMEMWQNANTMPQAVLTYKHKVSDTGDHLLPAPQRQQAEPPIQAFVSGLRISDENLKAAFSIWEASLGQRGPQESGKAINARKVESETATYNWGDNFNRALRLLGYVLDDLLPHYYNDPGRIVQITREDYSKHVVTMNQPFEDNGIEKIYDLRKGKNAIVIGAQAATLPTLRKEGAVAMLELTHSIPQTMAAAADLIVRQMDFPGKDSIADRLKKALPPQLVNDQQGQPSPELQQAMQQIDLLTKALNEATNETNRDRMKEEWATLREQMKQETALAVAELKDGSTNIQFLTQQLFQELQSVREALTAKTIGDTSSDGQTGGPEPSGGGQ